MVRGGFGDRWLWIQNKKSKIKVGGSKMVIQYGRFKMADMELLKNSQVWMKVGAGLFLDHWLGI